MEKKLTVRIAPDLADKLQARADHHRVSVSWIVRHLVLRYLDGFAPDLPVEEKLAIPAWRGLPVNGSTGETHLEEMQAEFTRLACTLFDAYRAEGCDVTESTKRANFALKARKHPWATYDVVCHAIRSTGRFRKQKGQMA
jgi:hypothetical protein